MLLLNLYTMEIIYRKLQKQSNKTESNFTYKVVQLQNSKLLYSRQKHMCLHLEILVFSTSSWQNSSIPSI